MPGFTTRPEIRGTFGVVATTHWLASSVAMSVLEKGGNAFDAAVAAGFTLQVVEPHLNGPLGEAPILVYSAENRRCDMICGQGVAPQGATIAHYKSLGLDLIPGTGLLAATVPGAFDAWARLARDYGTMPLAELMEPALGYAENGYPLVGRIRDTIMTVAELFRREWTTSAAVYLPGGNPPTPGKLFRNPALAATYRRVLAEAEAGGGNRERRIERARDAWYRGLCRRGDRPLLPHAEGARRLGTAPSRRADRRRHGALAGAGRDAADLRLPRLYRRQGRAVEPGAGAAAAAGAAAGVRSRRSRPGRAGVRPHRHRMRQARLCRPRGVVRRPRFRRCADGDVAEPRLQRHQRARLVGERASLELRPGQPGRARAYVLVGGADVAPAAGVGEPTVGPMGGIGEPTTSELGVVAGDTCHLDIIDRWGNMVSATPSGGWLQSSPVIPELGFCLGTRLQIAWLDERSASSLAPGKRPRSTLSPTLALEGRRAVDGVRHARRRRAGPMVDAAFPAPRASRHELAGGDRLPGIQQRPRAVLVLPARRQPGQPGAGRPLPGGDRRARWPSAATACGWARPGPAAA